MKGRKSLTAEQKRVRKLLTFPFTKYQLAGCPCRECRERRSKGLPEDNYLANLFRTARRQELGY